MAIKSFFYDSENGDRLYSATDFANAFNVGFTTGCIKRDDTENALGFLLSTNKDVIYAGKAIINGRFIEVEGSETLVIPSGTYSGQIVIQMNATETRDAKIVVKENQTPVQTSVIYELPLWDVTVENGIITTATDRRTQGGAYPKTITAREVGAYSIEDTETFVKNFKHTQSTLWEGASYLNTTITPTKNLKDCKNGWVLIWSDFDEGVGAKDINYAFSLIPRAFTQYPYTAGYNTLFLIPCYISTTEYRHIIKEATVFNGYLTGNENNSVPALSRDVVLRKIIEF